MKFKEFIEVKTLIKKGNVDVGEIGIIIDALDDPDVGYIVEFCNDTDYAPWATESYGHDEIEKL